MLKLLVLLALLLLTACRPSEEAPAPASAEPHTTRLARVLAAQSPEMRARYDARNPQQTLEFFGITPGMTVVEALPSGGWYSRILMAYLGADGALIGGNYPAELFRQFDFATEEFMASVAGWLETFPQQAADWCSEDCASVSGFFFGDLPAELHGTADAVDAWAAGDAGYLKRDFVLAQAEAAGFEFEASSEINANPADQPTSADIVWRLAPSLATTEEGTPEREAMAAIGESNRMTLKFRKPAFAADE